MSDLALTLIEKAKQNRATFLDLGNCGLTELPPSILELPWLEKLSLSRYYFDESENRWVSSTNIGQNNGLLPSALDVLGKLSQLHTLYLSDNESIRDIQVLGQLSQLHTLDLSHNENICDIQVLGQLSQLHTLDLSRTGINDIQVLGQLSQLHTLYLNDNKNIFDIQVIGQLSQLHTLDLSRTGINDIQVLGQLSRLHTLNLNYNESIRDIQVLGQLSRLHTLNLNGTGINDIQVLGQLSRLHTLNLSGTGINDIQVLGQLSQLHTLNLSGTGINDIQVLGQLSQLHTLNLSGTGINDVQVLGQLSQLHALNLSGTGINDIQVLGQLSQLHTLNLSGTGINDIQVLGQLSQLHTLSVCNCSVRDITPLLPFLKAGVEIKWHIYYGQQYGIYVEGCPIITPPVDIVKQGNTAILNYFRQISEQGGTVPLYEAKLIMVGEPGAGKTSLTKKLLDETHQVLADDPQKKSTLGINIEENWQFRDCKRPNELFTSHIWDFGGQEIQYMTHQFFLTPESLYVLVADDRKQHTLFPYWFEVIQLLSRDETGENSPILVVLNERGHKSITNFDLNEYRRKYPNLIIDMMEVDLAEPDLGRFQLVRDKVQQMLCSLKHVGRQLPRKWPQIRQAILACNDAKNHISEQEFADICAQYDVTRLDDRQLISKYLHQLGVILHFQQDRQLRDFIIINPTWALKAVYAVLENKEVNKRHGRFTDDDLDGYWQELTNDERLNILNLMKRDSFEICYPVNNHTYIAPQLLPAIRPSFDWDSHQSLKCHFYYRFMPKGIMTRLIVRKHEYLKQESLVWARGAIFHRFNCDILVVEQETERDGLIEIEVLGPVNNLIRALDFIRNEIEDIHEKWFSNIDYEERAPCNCTNCVGSANPTFFSWKDLSDYVDQNIETIDCKKGRIKKVPVIPLLEGVYDPQRIKHLRKYRSARQLPYDDAAGFRPTGKIAERSPQTMNPVLGLSPDPEPVVTQLNSVNMVPEKPEIPSSSSTGKPNWLALVATAAVIVLVFFAFAKPGSKLDFLGWFKAEQGSDSSKPPAVPTTATVVGSVVINGRNVSAEDVKQVRIKDQTLVQPAGLSNNRFLLREVEIPKDRLLEIAIDLKDGRSPSELFKLPQANENNTVDLREVLLEVKPVATGQRRAGRQNNPVIIIKNQNIQNANQSVNTPGDSSGRF